jgi:hypothetical protein
MKKAVLFTIIFSLSLFLGNKSMASVSGDDNKWVLNKSVGNVDLFYKISECNGEKVIFLKFDNKNDYSVKITWKEAIADKVFGNVVDCHNGDKQLTLSPGITVQDDCTSALSPECRINVQNAIPTHVADPFGLEFKNVTVSKVTN